MNDEQLVTMFSAFVAEKPGDPRFARLGDIYLQRGDLRKALEILTAGVSANPTYVTGQQVLARALLKAGYFKEARDRFDIVLRIDPGNVAAIWEIARIEFKQGNTKDGIERLKGLLSLDPFDEKAKRELKNLNVEVSEQTLPAMQAKPTEAIEQKAATPAPPQKSEIVFNGIEKRSAPTIDEITSVEKELEELLKMDISGEDTSGGFDMDQMSSEEGLLAPESVFEPIEEEEESEAGIESKRDFVSPEIASAKKASESLLESAVSSIEESMPEFDLGAFSAAPAPTTPKVQPPPAAVEEPDLSEGFGSFNLEETTQTAPAPLIETPVEEQAVTAEDMPAFDIYDRADEDFDFTPPSSQTNIKAPPEASRAVAPPEAPDSSALEDGFDFTPPSKEEPAVVQKEEPSKAVDAVPDDFFDFTPPPRQKAPTVKPTSMADALKQLEVVEEPEVSPEPQVAATPTGEAKTPAPAPRGEIEQEKITADDIPVFDIGAPEKPKADITSIGGYFFTEDIGQENPSPAVDDIGIEFRHEFKPAQEPLEIEGFEGTASFNPPSEKLSSPEFTEIEFADELDGIVPRGENGALGEAAEPAEEPQGEDASDFADGQDMNTVTFAEICVGQGKIKRAISIYKAILQKTAEPNERDRFEKRIDHLKKILSSGIDASSS